METPCKNCGKETAFVFCSKRCRVLYEAEQEHATTIQPEEPGNVIDKERLLYQLHHMKGRLEVIQASHHARAVQDLLSRANRTRKDVEHTYWTETDPEVAESYWRIQKGNLANLLDEMRPLEELAERFPEWMKMVDEMIEAAKQDTTNN